jgi:hypothetical protein
MRDAALLDEYPRIAPASRSPRTPPYRRFGVVARGVREGSGLDLDPREELGAVGDGSHIAMVTSGTDAEDAMDYQGGGPSVRGLERQGSQTLSLRRPARRSGRARPRTPPWSSYTRTSNPRPDIRREFENALRELDGHFGERRGLFNRIRYRREVRRLKGRYFLYVPQISQVVKLSEIRDREDLAPEADLSSPNA